MELWFWLAVMTAVLAGLSNFYFKVAANRGYDPELFSLYGGTLSVVMVAIAWIAFPAPLVIDGGMYSILAFGGGLLISGNNIGKIYALRYIDATVYYPLYKLLAPLLAIVAGVIFFSERFSQFEWFGMILSLLVPLMLITKTENGRQSNLFKGLLLVLMTGVFSAGGAFLYKLSSDAGMATVVILLFASLGLLVSSFCTIWYKSGIANIKQRIVRNTSKGLFIGASMRAVLITLAFVCTLLAFKNDGPFAVVMTIQSMYILIPIILAIIFYNEHWNLQKATAIVLSVAALALLG